MRGAGARVMSRALATAGGFGPPRTLGASSLASRFGRRRVPVGVRPAPSLVRATDDVGTSFASAAAASSSSASPRPPPPTEGEVVDVECTALAFGGRGVCKLPDSGFVLFCERAVPGERVRAEVSRVKKGGRFADAIKLETLRASPARVDPPCPHFHRCGGCTWQDLAYDAQLELKRGQVVDVAARFAKMPPDDAERVTGACLPSPRIERYRNKMEFAFAPGANPGEAARVGLRPRGDHDGIVELGAPRDDAPGSPPLGCLLQTETGDAVVAAVASHLGEHPGARECLPAFDRRTGEGVLRSLTVRVFGDAAMVEIAAATGGASGSAAAAALKALADDVADRVPAVTSVVLTPVASEPELRRADGRRQAWVKGGQGRSRIKGQGVGRRKRAKSEGGETHEGSAAEPGDAAAVSDGPSVVLRGARTIPATLRGVRFELSAASFFQTNAFQTERLAAAVTRACGFSGARTETVLDLFCGVGALGLSVAAEAKAVRGWDIVPEAVADANAAAKANGIANAEFEVADLHRARRALESQRRTCPERAAGSERTPPATTKTTKTTFESHPDVVIVDPARAGMDATLVRLLREIGAPRIVYVSCNPATQARDAARLAGDGDEGGGGGAGSAGLPRYEMASLEPVDMFPHTPHVETVAVFLRKEEEEGSDSSRQPGGR